VLRGGTDSWGLTLDSNGVGVTDEDVQLSNVEAVTAPCDEIEVATIGPDGEKTRVGLRLADQVTFIDLAPLVIERRDVAKAPTTAIGCDAPSGVDPPSNQDQTAVSSPHDQPAAALREFLADPTRAELIDSGYIEMHADDGSITYGRDLGNGWVTLVHVTPKDAGWVVDRWTASGC